MKSRTRQIMVVLLGICLLLAVVWTIGMASDDLTDSFSIAWWTADGGGGDSTGGPYALSGTAGQPDAGRASGGDYALVGGFWSAVWLEQGPTTLYMPMVTR